MKTDKVVNKHHLYLICNKGAATLNCELGPGSSDFLTCNFDSGDAQGHDLGKSEIWGIIEPTTSSKFQMSKVNRMYHNSNLFWTENPEFSTEGKSTQS